MGEKNTPDEKIMNTLNNPYHIFWECEDTTEVVAQKCSVNGTPKTFTGKFTGNLPENICDEVNI